MEFAVSRALGKYRRRLSSSKTQDCDNIVPLSEEVVPTVKRLVETSDSIESNDSGRSNITVTNFATVPNVRLKSQASLDVTNWRSEEDDRSSNRSMSRVSSRRQSTEDSIDSEDEWYCYELRKLEEMEKKAVRIDAINDEINNIPETEFRDEQEEDSQFKKIVGSEGVENLSICKPDDPIKEKMSFVLKELKSKVSPSDCFTFTPPSPPPLPPSPPQPQRKKLKMIQDIDSADILFPRIRDCQSWKESKNFRKSSDQISVKSYDEAAVDSGSLTNLSTKGYSSGNTSGPDSPVQTEDELDSNTANISQAEVAIPEIKIESPVNCPIIISSAPINTSSIPETIVTSSSQDFGGSKWKLLKALKEKKMEEKGIDGGRDLTNTSVTNSNVPNFDRVSVLGLMQKFYEIHVRN